MGRGKRSHLRIEIEGHKDFTQVQTPRRVKSLLPASCIDIWVFTMVDLAVDSARARWATTSAGRSSAYGVYDERDPSKGLPGWFI